jgi:hypothetical protein
LTVLQLPLPEGSITGMDHHTQLLNSSNYGSYDMGSRVPVMEVNPTWSVVKSSRELGPAASLGDLNNFALASFVQQISFLCSALPEDPSPLCTQQKMGSHHDCGVPHNPSPEFLLVLQPNIVLDGLTTLPPYLVLNYGVCAQLPLLGWGHMALHGKTPATSFLPSIPVGNDTYAWSCGPQASVSSADISLREERPPEQRLWRGSLAGLGPNTAHSF